MTSTPSRVSYWTLKLSRAHWLFNWTPASYRNHYDNKFKYWYIADPGYYWGIRQRIINE